MPMATNPHVRDSSPAGRLCPFERLRRWSPFVLPSSPLQCMTSVVISRRGITLARGRLDGRYFHVESTLHREGPDLSDALAGVRGWTEGPVCVSLPRSRVLDRHFRIPAESDAEIEAMLPHLLSAELPLSPEYFSWVWSRLPGRGDGFTLIKVFVARNDHLEEFLTPLLVAGLDVVNLIPEGWSWAQTIAWVGGAGLEDDEPVDRSFVIQSEGAPYLLVERGGELLFDLLLPSPIGADATLASDGEPSRSTDRRELPDELSEARRAFESLLGIPLPEPQRWDRGNPRPEAFDRLSPDFAAAVAVTGLRQERSLMPPAEQRRFRRNVALGTFASLTRLALVTLLVWVALVTLEGVHAREHLATLQQQIDDQLPRVTVLEREHAAIRESHRERADHAEILHALASLRRHVAPSIYLEHLSYVKGHGVTLRGGAPANSAVLEMAETLGADQLWRDLRVMQLRSENTDGSHPVHFVVEGHLN